MNPYGGIVGTKTLVRATSAGLTRTIRSDRIHFFFYELDDFDVRTWVRLAAGESWETI